MPRFLTTNQRNAFATRNIGLVALVTIKYVSGDVTLCTRPKDLTVSGVTYIGKGDLLDLQLPKENGALEISPGVIRLNGLQVALLSLALNENTENRPVFIDVAVFNNDTGQMVDLPFRFQRGTTGQIRILPNMGNSSGGARRSE